MATPVFCCGFECGRASAHTDETILGWALSGTGGFATALKRSGDRSLRANPTATTGLQGATCNIVNGQNNVLRVYVYFTTLPTLSDQIATFKLGATYAGAYFQASDSKIYAGYGTSNLGATVVSVTTGVWYRLDIRVDSDSNPWTIDVQVDGSACGQKTNAVAATNATLISLEMNPLVALTADMYWDDVLLSQTIADYPLGAGYVNHFVPTADGTHNIAGANDFERGTTGTDIINTTTDSYLLVDEVPLDDATPDTDDFIAMIIPVDDTDYTENVFGPAPGVSTPSAGPRAVEVLVGFHQASTGNGNMELRLNDNGTTGVIVTRTAVAGTTTVKYASKHFADPPSAASTWTVVAGNGNFNDVRIRFGSPVIVDANPDQYFDCAMIEAEFSGDPPAMGQPTPVRSDGVPTRGMRDRPARWN